MDGKLSKEDSWKKKIDPAYDRIIKYYIRFVDFFGLSTNTGWMALQDEALQLWEKKGMQGWIKSYERNMTDEKKMLMKWKFPKVVTEREREKARRDFEKELLEDIKTLPEDSQDYYKKVFAPFYSETVADDYFKNMTIDKLKGVLADFLTDQFVLFLHTSMIEMEKEYKNSSEAALEKKYFRQSIIINVLLSAYNSICALVFEKSLTQLLKEAKNGNEDSFFDLLQIDRTVIECDWAQKMIRKAQLKGDDKFFRRMAKAIVKSPLQNAKQFTTARMVIVVFWHLGLRKLKYYEIRRLLKSCGLVVQDADPFRRFVQRLEKATSQKDIITFHKNTPVS